MLKANVEFKVKEVGNPDLSAKVIAKNIVDGLKRGMKHRMLMGMEMEKAMAAGAKGVKVWVSGDFGSPKHSRTDKASKGFVPLQTLRADIDYANEIAKLPYGVLGIKVWIYRGEIFDKQ